MRYFSRGGLSVTLALWSLALSGCGYLPSEMEGKPKTENAKPPQATAGVALHAVGCEVRAKNFKLLKFDDLYTFTDDSSPPFQPAANLPARYDVHAFVWGYDNCMARGACQHGDHYWLIKRGAEGDFTTWVVTPQFPRITTKSRCKERLKVGERYRFSFENGKLVGFSKN